MDIWAPQFSQVQAAQATMVPVGRMRVWFQRGHLKYAENDVAGSAGLASKLSARTVLRIGIMGALTGLNVPPEVAAKAVVSFMENGKATSPLSPARDGGGLFSEGETVLCIYEGGKSKVHCYQEGARFDPIASREAVTMLWVDELHDTILRRLQTMSRLPAPILEKAEA